MAIPYKQRPGSLLPEGLEELSEEDKIRRAIMAHIEQGRGSRVFINSASPDMGYKPGDTGNAAWRAKMDWLMLALKGGR